MRTWTPYHQTRAGGGSDLRQDDLDYRPPRTPEEVEEDRRARRLASLTLADIAARDDTPYDATDLHEVLDIMGLLDE